jgi:hypothetical protein
MGESRGGKVKRWTDVLLRVGALEVGVSEAEVGASEAETEAEAGVSEA